MLKMLLEPGREWGELVEQLAWFPPFKSMPGLPATIFWIPSQSIVSCGTWATHPQPGVPGVGKATRGVCHPTPGLSHCPGWNQPSRAPQPRMELGKGHFVPSKSPGPGPAHPWEEGSPPAMAGEGLVPACTHHRRLVEREASLKVTRFFPSFFNESLAFLGLCHAAVAVGWEGQDLIVVRGSWCLDGLGRDAGPDLWSWLKSEMLLLGNSVKSLQCFVFLWGQVRASGLWVQAGSGHTALLPAGCPPSHGHLCVLAPWEQREEGWWV